MKAFLQLLLPVQKRMSSLCKQMRGGRKNSRAALQLLGALFAAVLARSHRVTLRPPFRQCTIAAFGGFGDQRAHWQDAGGSARLPSRGQVQPAQDPFAQAANPAVQG
jgi:hypothetical protein